MSPSSSGHVNMMKGQPFHVKYREIIRRLIFDWRIIGLSTRSAYSVPGIDNIALARFFNANEGTFLVCLTCFLAVH
jgi:preprotein translocase subunit SecY